MRQTLVLTNSHWEPYTVLHLKGASALGYHCDVIWMWCRSEAYCWILWQSPSIIMPPCPLSSTFRILWRKPRSWVTVEQLWRKPCLHELRYFVKFTIVYWTRIFQESWVQWDFSTFSRSCFLWIGTTNDFSTSLGSWPGNCDLLNKKPGVGASST